MRSMIRKETSSDSRRTSGKPLASLGRWLCGHSPSDKHLSIQSSLFSFRDEPSFSNNAFSSSIDFQDAATFSQLSSWDKTLAQAFVSWCAQDWLKPLPGLLEVVPDLEPRPLSRRGEFLRYGSDFLRYKSSTASVQCSRVALFLAGGLRNGADLNNIRNEASFSEVLKLKKSALAFFSNSLGSSFVDPSGALGAFQGLLRRLSAPSSPSPSKAVAQPFVALESFAVLLPWDSSTEQPWSTPLQVTTAVAVALPMLLGTVQVQPSLQFRTHSSLGWGISPTPTAAPTKSNLSATRLSNLAIPTKARINKNPTGRIANIQTYVLPAKGEFTSGYGWRWGRMHRGIDIAGPVGTPVVAAASGKVITASWDNTGFGNRIEIQHPDGTITLYGHNSRIVTHVGAMVHQGQQIAEMGSTGHSTGSHSHFEIHPSGKEAVNPMSFLAGQKLVLPPA
jgi:murein DD-endopeptidase MepM/ murein hydrolase activator NlpD